VISTNVLGVAVLLGYLQKADYAAKEGGGIRLPRYIMARRLGPYRRLDISGYAAHLSVTAGDLEIAMSNPRDFAKKRMKESHSDANQLALDLGHDDNDIWA
jgi:hypothetical protein